MVLMFNVLLTLSLYLPASTESTSMTIETRNHTLNTSHGLLAEEESGQVNYKRRDMSAAKRFFSLAVRNNGSPRVITLDGYAASHLAVAKLKAAGTLPCRVRI